MRRDQATTAPLVNFYGSHVELSMPSGVTLQSVATDQTFSHLPSWKRNGPTDFLQDFNPVLGSNYPACAVWPSDPPRGDTYCETGMLLHPLVSPITATDWSGAPPAWFAMGEERQSDSAKILAKYMAGQGVSVQWEDYRFMPHNWPMLLSGFWQASRCLEQWTGACKAFASGQRPTSKVQIVEVDGNVREMHIESLTDLTREDGMQSMLAKQATMKPWTGPRSTIAKSSL